MRKQLYRLWSSTLYSRNDPGFPGTLLELGLTPASYLYGTATGIRNALYDLDLLPAGDLGRPTISVGNLTTGGTGKTPFVEMIARRISNQNKNVAILSRGYGTSNETDSRDDEALPDDLENSTVRRFTGADRYESARRARTVWSPDVFVLDDGFQHRSVLRDLDIVLVDGLRGFGTERPLPAGPLRESMSQLHRARMAVITRSNRITHSERSSLEELLDQYLPPEAPVLHAVHRPSKIVQHTDKQNEQIVSPADIREQNLMAFCGIGTPESFRHTLEDLGLRPATFLPYPDHYTYPASEQRSIREQARNQDMDYLLTTRKDAQKWNHNPEVSPPLLVVHVELELIEGEEVMEERLNELLTLY